MRLVCMDYTVLQIMQCQSIYSCFQTQSDATVTGNVENEASAIVRCPLITLDTALHNVIDHRVKGHDPLSCFFCLLSATSALKSIQ